MAANELMVSFSFIDHECEVFLIFFPCCKNCQPKQNSWHSHIVVEPRSSRHEQSVYYPRHCTSIGLSQTCTVLSLKTIDAKRQD